MKFCFRLNNVVSPTIFFTLAFLVLEFTYPYLSSAEEPKSKLKVGIVLPLSGEVAPFGEAFRKGISIFEEENVDKEPKVEFLLEDGAYDGKTTISAMHKLNDIDRADIQIIWGNTPAHSAAPIAENNNIPILAVTHEPLGKSKKNVVTFGPKTKSVIEMIVKQLKEWNIPEPAAVTIDIGTAVAAVDMIKKNFSENMPVHTAATNEQDFKTIITKLKATKTKGLVLFLMPEQALSFLRQATDIRYNPKIIGGDIFADEDFRQRALAHKMDISFVYGAVRDDFIEKLIARFGGQSHFYEAAAGYSLAKFFSRLAHITNKYDRESLFSNFKEVDLKDLATVNLEFIEDEEYGLHFTNPSKVYLIK